MSLKDLMNHPEVCARLEWAIPEPDQRQIRGACRVPPTSAPQRQGLIGTAVDYALRFELHRANPHAVVRPWVADLALGRLPLRDARRRALEAAVDEARRHVGHYRTCRARWCRHTVARCALLLAQLEPLYRAGYLDPQPLRVDPVDIDEVLRLVAVAPVGALSHPQVMHLNPDFARFSSFVGGADADHISGTRLIDFKLNCKGVVEPEHIRQLLGYAILARWAFEADNRFPAVASVGVYFARHACLWMLNEGTLRHSQFRATAAWLRDFVEKNRETAS